MKLHIDAMIRKYGVMYWRDSKTEYKPAATKRG